MGDRESQSKPEEQYPLLKVDGGGDMGQLQSQQSHIRTTGWGVTCTNRYPRFSRWPEIISACWMTLILCGISFLIFYALGMGVYRRHQFIVMKCKNNISRPASNVFYHYIVPRGRQIPFVLYTEYLAHMATQYPLLKFHVFFLVEDSYPDTLRGLRRNLPYYAHSTSKLDEIGKEALVEFQRRYQNVNVTIMPLSKYMATTTLRFKYKLIPTMHLPFYIRASTVWQNGGIGMDLRSFNNDFHSSRFTDSRINAIMRQHNDGINPEDYTNALNKLDDKDEENAVFSLFYGLIDHLFNETRSIFNKTLTLPTENNILDAAHRGKREISNYSDAADSNETTNDFKTPDKIISNNDVHSVNIVAENLTMDKDPSVEIVKNSTNSQNFVLANETALHGPKSTSNGSETRQIVLFYDFSAISDVGPAFLLPEPLSPPFLGVDVKNPGFINRKSSNSAKTNSHLLSLDSAGNFIAASTKLHPFLGHLISAGCQRMPPKFVIQDALLSQCSGIFRDDVYCNNIYIL